MSARPAKDIENRLHEAARHCERDGSRFTELRRDILGLILAADRPVTAYDLLDLIRQQRRGAAPPTVYRALDFLLAHGLIHRVERLSAFIGCTEAEAHSHPAQFLICRECGTVAELEDQTVLTALAEAAARQGFRAARLTVEVEGVCATCGDGQTRGRPDSR